MPRPRSKSLNSGQPRTNPIFNPEENVQESSSDDDNPIVNPEEENVQEDNSSDDDGDNSQPEKIEGSENPEVNVEESQKDDDQLQQQQQAAEESSFLPSFEAMKIKDEEKSDVEPSHKEDDDDQPDEPETAASSSSKKKKNKKKKKTKDIVSADDADEDKLPQEDVPLWPDDGGEVEYELIDLEDPNVEFYAYIRQPHALIRPPALRVIEDLYYKQPKPDKREQQHIVEFVSRLVPFVNSQLIIELRRANFVTLYFELFPVSSPRQKLLGIFVRFFDAGYRTRLLDLKSFDVNKGEDVKNDQILTALKDTINATGGIFQQCKILDKIISIQSQSLPSLVNPLAVDLSLNPADLFSFYNASFDLEEIIDDTINRCVPFKFMELLYAFRRHFSSAETIEYAKKAYGIVFNSLGYYFGFQPVFANPDSLIANVKTLRDFLAPINWPPLCAYFATESRDHDPDFVLLKQHFASDDIIIKVVWCHLIGYISSCEFRRLVPLLQDCGENNIWFRVRSLNVALTLVIRFLNGGFLAHKYNQENWKKLTSEQRAEMNEQLDKFARHFEEQYNLKFGQLIRSFANLEFLQPHGKEIEPFQWIYMHDGFKPTEASEVMLRDGVLPAKVRDRLPGRNLQKTLYAELVTLNNIIAHLARAEQKAFEKENPEKYKQFKTKKERIVFNKDHPENKQKAFTKADFQYERWRDLLNGPHREKLPNLSLILNYVFSLPLGFDARVRAIVRDVSAWWRREHKRVGGSEHQVQLQVVKAAAQVRFHRILQSKETIQRFAPARVPAPITAPVTAAAPKNQNKKGTKRK